MSYLINIQHFKKQYRDTCIQFDEIVISARVTLLLGKNGSGKSTIIKGITGLIHYQGDIISTPLSFAYMCELPIFPKDISVQRFLFLLNEISVNPVEDKVIFDLLDIFHLEHKKDAYLSHLSKGMKAKVNLLQCLMSQADVYVLDEPLSGLDREAIDCLINYILASKKQFIISTHQLHEWSNLTAEVLYL